MNRSEVAGRLKSFLVQRYGTVNAAGEALGTSGDSIRNTYLNGKSLPGAEFLAALIDAGCDIHWLLTGKRTAGEADTRYPEYRVDATVSAGTGRATAYSEWYETEILDFDPQTHAFLKVDADFGFSLMPFIQPGDYVLISYNDKIQDGDIVAAKWQGEKGALKIVSFSETEKSLIHLHSYNQSIKPLTFRKKDVLLYKVVLVKKTGQGW